MLAQGSSECQALAARLVRWTPIVLSGLRPVIVDRQIPAEPQANIGIVLNQIAQPSPVAQQAGERRFPLEDERSAVIQALDSTATPQEVLPYHRQVARRAVDQYHHVRLERRHAKRIADAGGVDCESSSEAALQRLHCGLEGTLRPGKQAQSAVIRNK